MMVSLTTKKEKKVVNKVLCVTDINDIKELFNLNDYDFTSNGKVNVKYIEHDTCENSENEYLQVVPYVTLYYINIKLGYISFIKFNLLNNTTIGIENHINSNYEKYLSDNSQLSIKELLELAFMVGKNTITDIFGEELINKFNLTPKIKDYAFFIGDNSLEYNKKHVGVNIPIMLSEEQLNMLLTQTNINSNEIHSIESLYINLTSVLENFNIMYDLHNIITELSINDNLNDWSCKVLFHICYDFLSNFQNTIPYKKLLEIAKINNEEQENEIKENLILH